MFTGISGPERGTYVNKGYFVGVMLFKAKIVLRIWKAWQG